MQADKKVVEWVRSLSSDNNNNRKQLSMNIFVSTSQRPHISTSNVYFIYTNQEKNRNKINTQKNSMCILLGSFFLVQFTTIGG